MFIDEPQTKKDGGGDDTPEVVHPDPDAPGTDAGKYVHPDVPGDPVVDNTQL